MEQDWLCPHCGKPIGKVTLTPTGKVTIWPMPYASPNNTPTDWPKIVMRTDGNTISQ